MLTFIKTEFLKLKHSKIFLLTVLGALTLPFLLYLSLISGNADLVRYDFNGNRTIVEHFSKNDIFGEVFYNVITFL